MKHTYVGDIPDRLLPLVTPEGWHLDWERMGQPGRVEIQFRIFSDYGSHVARFPEFAAYHREHQPRALLLWGRHDPYYDIEEAFAYAKDLDRIDMHIYDGPHLLLETHHEACVPLMRDFIIDVQAENIEK